jgi:hypothetical protein
VLNVAFSFPATSFYWEDPINQALMRAWDNGITVIAPAGNGGNKQMTVGVPGNNPYVITVGAMDDNRTPVDTSDDIVASFSSYGPTVEGFMKPEVLAPGTNVRGFVAQNSFLADKNGTSGISGTSQATAVAAGVVALMIQQDPSLTPNEIKCRLMSSASQAKKQNGELAFSPFAQGAGLINASAAINSTAVGCANSGLNIANDINLRSHYFGPARFNEKTNEFILGEDEQANGVIWNNESATPRDEVADGVIWNNESAAPRDEVADGVIWNNERATPRDEVADGVIWNNERATPRDEAADGVIWNNERVTPREVADGVIWNNERATPRDEVADGVIWNNERVTPREAADGVIWNNERATPRDEAADGVIWNNERVTPREAADGVIWNNERVTPREVADGVIWNNERATPRDEAADGVIWNNERVTPRDEVADGVIWNNESVTPRDEMTNGVIWNNEKIIPYHEAIEVTHAEIVANSPGISVASPQMKPIKKWTAQNMSRENTVFNNLIKLDTYYKN